MKRTLVMCCALAILAMGGQASAARTYTGTVQTAVAHPAVPRAMYLESQKLNGATGFVVPVQYAAAERPFELRRVRGATGRDDLDVWFYRDISGTGDPCPRTVDTQTETLETGTACAGATYAVVVLFAGADATFELTL